MRTKIKKTHRSFWDHPKLYAIYEWIYDFRSWHEYYNGAMKWRYRIVRIKSWNCFVVDEITSSGIVVARYVVMPIWNLIRIKKLVKQCMAVIHRL